jgi:double-stranded uracil-DNA glycosylase
VERRQSLCSSSLDQQKRTATKSGQIMVSEFGMVILPDLLANNLDLVIVGTAAGRVSAKRGLYYAGPGNRFWRTLHEVGLTPTELQPDDYAKLLHYGIGLTDLAKGACGDDSNLKPADFDRMRLRAVIKTRSPRLVAFNGKTAAARYFDVPTAQINYGRQPDTIGQTAVYVCSSTSAANGHWSCEAWQDLGRTVGKV